MILVKAMCTSASFLWIQWNPCAARGGKGSDPETDKKLFSPENPVSVSGSLYKRGFTDSRRVCAQSRLVLLTDIILYILVDIFFHGSQAHRLKNLEKGVQNTACFTGNTHCAQNLQLHKQTCQRNMFKEAIQT